MISSKTQLSDDFKLVENFIGVWGVFQFIGQVLSGPMFVVFSTSPQPGCCDIVNQSAESNPNFRFILSIPQGQL